MTQVKLDGGRLRSITNASHSAEVTMTALALRERNRHFSDIGRTKTALIRAGEKIVDEEYRKFWKDLEAAGVGSIIYGRRGAPDRFEWYYALKMIADAALTGKDVMTDKTVAEAPVKATPKAKGARVAAPKAPGKAEPSKGGKMVYIPLRKDFFLDISVPNDLSADEAEVIVQALKRATG